MRRLVLLLAVVLAVLAAGSCRKRPKTVSLPPPPSPQAQTAPGLTPPAQQPPQEEPKKPAEEKPAAGEKQPPAPAVAGETPPPAPKPAPRRTAPRQGGATTVAQNQPPGNHVSPPPQLEAPLSREQEQFYRTRAQETITETERHLAVLKARKLTDEQQGMVKQALTFLTQARQALAAGDLVRAANLAHKAHLLSVELLGNTQ